MKTRHFEFDMTRHGFDNDVPAADLHAFQTAFDAEAIQRDPTDVKMPYDGVWASWGLPLAILAGVIIWAVVADFAIDWISTRWLTEIR